MGTEAHGRRLSRVLVALASALGCERTAEVVPAPGVRWLSVEAGDWREVPTPSLGPLVPAAEFSAPLLAGQSLVGWRAVDAIPDALGVGRPVLDGARACAAGRVEPAWDGATSSALEPLSRRFRLAGLTCGEGRSSGTLVARCEGFTSCPGARYEKDGCCLDVSLGPTCLADLELRIELDGRLSASPPCELSPADAPLAGRIRCGALECDLELVPDGVDVECDPEVGCALRCPPGTVDCDGDLGTGCETTGTNACCPAGLAECDGDLDALCETSVLDEDEHCGRCGRACGADARCHDGECRCRDALTGDCDDAPGCETNLAADPAHCGGCGQSCGANAACDKRRCVCLPGFADCDGRPGCEAELGRSAASCGACGRSCPPGQVCFDGACGLAAPLGLATLDGSPPAGDVMSPSIAVGGASGTDVRLAFSSDASNFVPSDRNQLPDIFLVRTGSAVVRLAGLAEPNGTSVRPSFSETGALLAFESEATNLVVSESKLLVAADPGLETVSIAFDGDRTVVGRATADGLHLHACTEAPGACTSTRVPDVVAVDVAVAGTVTWALAIEGPSRALAMYTCGGGACSRLTPIAREAGPIADAQVVASGEGAAAVFLRDGELWYWGFSDPDDAAPTLRAIGPGPYLGLDLASHPSPLFVAWREGAVDVFTCVTAGCATVGVETIPRAGIVAAELDRASHAAPALLCRFGDGRLELSSCADVACSALEAPRVTLEGVLAARLASSATLDHVAYVLDEPQRLLRLASVRADGKRQTGVLDRVDALRFEVAAAWDRLPRVVHQSQGAAIRRTTCPAPGCAGGGVPLAEGRTRNVFLHDVVARRTVEITAPFARGFRGFHAPRVSERLGLVAFLAEVDGGIVPAAYRLESATLTFFGLDPTGPEVGDTSSLGLSGSTVVFATDRPGILPEAPSGRRVVAADSGKLTLVPTPPGLVARDLVPLDRGEVAALLAPEVWTSTRTEADGGRLTLAVGDGPPVLAHAGRLWRCEGLGCGRLVPAGPPGLLARRVFGGPGRGLFVVVEEGGVFSARRCEDPSCAALSAPVQALPGAPVAAEVSSAGRFVFATVTPDDKDLWLTQCEGGACSPGRMVGPHSRTTRAFVDFLPSGEAIVSVGGGGSATFRCPGFDCVPVLYGPAGGPFVAEPSEGVVVADSADPTRLTRCAQGLCDEAGLLAPEPMRAAAVARTDDRIAFGLLPPLGGPVLVELDPTLGRRAIVRLADRGAPPSELALAAEPSGGLWVAMVEPRSPGRLSVRRCADVGCGAEARLGVLEPRGVARFPALGVDGGLVGLTGHGGRLAVASDALGRPPGGDVLLVDPLDDSVSGRISAELLGGRALELSTAGHLFAATVLPEGRGPIRLVVGGAEPEGPRRELCGDGVPTGDEPCDDGNLRSGDGCTSACRRESFPLPPSGAPAAWIVLGPFEGPASCGFPGRGPLDPAELTPAPGRAIAGEVWSLARPGQCDQECGSYPAGTVDLGCVLADGIAYAHTYVVSPERQTVRLVGAADDGIKVYVNGALAADWSSQCACVGVGSELAGEATLEAGTNRVLVVAHNAEGPFAFRLAIVSPDGGLAPPGVGTTLAP